MPSRIKINKMQEAKKNKKIKMRILTDQENLINKSLLEYQFKRIHERLWKHESVF